MALNQFSTGNPQSDRMQIEAEQYDPEEEYPYGQPDEHEDDGFEEEEAAPVMVLACAGSSACARWWNMEYIGETDFPAWVERMKTEHSKKCGCSADIIFSK